MSLSSLQIDAFLAVCETKSFTAAAAKLHITQSALSQRIKNLEDELGSTLFVRESTGVRTTDLGERLLRYGKTKEALEGEFLDQVTAGGRRGLRGVVRIAGFSTVTKSIVIPELARFVHANPDLQIELKTAELGELPGMLATGRTDFVLVTDPIRREGVENELLGHERNVLIKRKAGDSRDDVYLDHDENDSTTLDFFAAQDRRPAKNFRRAYLGDIESIPWNVVGGLIQTHLRTAPAKSVPTEEPIRAVKVVTVGV
ncbi:MAG: LysR family transcriptional regulator, partial [Bdellovibrionota bacterium]